MAAAVGPSSQTEHFQAETNSRDDSKQERVSESQKSPTSTGPSDNKPIDMDESSTEGGEGRLDAEEKTASKVNKFDNKTFVLAPLPKTNPWNRGKAPTSPTQKTVVDHSPGKLSHC